MKKNKTIYECEKLKGNHDFLRTGAEPITFLNSDIVFVYKKCKGCFRQKIEETTKMTLQKEISNAKEVI